MSVAPAGLHVLLVEDEPAHARLATALLREAGPEFSVHHVDTIGGAVAELSNGSGHDAVLLDLRLPDGHGLAALERVMGVARERPVLILSSLADEQLAVEAVGVGAEDYLVKDQIDPETLGRALRYAVSRRGRPVSATPPTSREAVVPVAATSVALLGGHALVLEGLVASLRAAGGFELLGAFADPVAYRRAVGTRRPDVLVVESMGPNGTDVAQVRAEIGPAKVVILADTTDRHLHTVLNRDADGLVLTSSSSRQVIGAIAQVLEGQVVLPGGWRSLPEPQLPHERLAGLSRRQLEVLQLVAEGCSNEEIASRLYISLNTVKFHIRTLYGRLGIHNRVQAALLLADGMPPVSPRA